LLLAFLADIGAAICIGYLRQRGDSDCVAPTFV
jgi:hypothetical protein